jgi:RNA ligase (TIGR02306 family)
VLVVEIENVTKHPGADALEIIKVKGYDYSIVSKLGEFKVGELGIFIEPDYMVPTDRPEFRFLQKETKEKGKQKRITCRKLRGVWSEGLLIKAQSWHKIGDNVMEEYGITRWEPPPIKNVWGSKGASLKSGLQAKEPSIPGILKIPNYDLENYKKYRYLLEEGESVYYTTKIHGASCRYVFWNGKMHCGSRTTWKKNPEEKEKLSELIEINIPQCSWWEALKFNPWIEEWCKANPGIIIYGELFGSNVQGDKFHYGIKKGEYGVRIFDVRKNNNWVPFKELLSSKEFEGLKLVPLLYNGGHKHDLLEKLAEEPETSLEGCGKDHIREGIVIKTEVEKINEKIGRVALKYVSRNYLMRS